MSMKWRTRTVRLTPDDRAELLLAAGFLLKFFRETAQRELTADGARAYRQRTAHVNRIIRKLEGRRRGPHQPGGR